MMASVIEKYSNKIIITNDNPRDEDPNAIIDDILKGLKGKKHLIIKNRKEAILEAIKKSNNNSIIAVLGKGIEEFQIIKGKKIPHSDIAIIKSYINENRN